MNFISAMRFLLAGKKIRATTWPETDYLFIKDNTLYSSAWVEKMFSKSERIECILCAPDNDLIDDFMEIEFSQEFVEVKL